MVSQNQTALVMRKKEAARVIGVSIATLDRLRVEGSFVRPIQLGKQAIGFLRSDVEDWVASRPYKMHFAFSAF